MAKDYWIRFGSENPQTTSGLTPTLSTFISAGGTNMTAPTLMEVGASTGAYKFTYDPSPTFSIFFTADGGSVLADSDRYICGVLDPISAVDTRLGFVQDSYGSTASDPTTAIGYLKRLQELLEGDAVFTKSTGVWTISSRGSTTLLRSKSLTNNTTSATKS